MIFITEMKKRNMKRIALMMVLILLGIVFLNTSKTNDIRPTHDSEEGSEDIIGQEALKHL